MANTVLVSLLLVQLVILVLVFFLFFLCFTPWIRSFVSGGKVKLIDVIGMRMRRVPVNLIVDAHITLNHQGKSTPIKVIEACYLANKHKIHDLNTLLEILPKYEIQFEHIHSNVTK